MLVLSVVLARADVWAQRAGYVFALSPIIVGATLGIGLALLANAAGGANRPALLISAMILALVCAASEHVFFYADYRAKILESAHNDPKLQMFDAAADLPVPTFCEFIRASIDLQCRGRSAKLAVVDNRSGIDYRGICGLRVVAFDSAISERLTRIALLISAS